MLSLKVNFEENNACLCLKFLQNNELFNTCFGEIYYIDLCKPYTGSYEIVPAYSEQIIQTKGLKMTDNFIIKSILDTTEILILDGMDSTTLISRIVDGG